MARRFTPYDETIPVNYQIHLLLEGEANSVSGNDAHFTLLESYTYSKANGEMILVNSSKQDMRLASSLQLSAIQTVPVTMPRTRARCSENNGTCAEYNKASQELEESCAPCLVANTTTLCKVCETKATAEASTLCATCHAAGSDDNDKDDSGDNDAVNSYAMAWTDGGRRNVSQTIQTTPKRKETRQLKDVGGWAFLLLCGRGHKYVASGCLGEKSTNNIAEFRAIKEVMLKAVAVNINQIDINTDSMIAVQYYEGTCARDSDHLAKIFREIEEIAETNQIQFKLKHVKAHADDFNNRLVDSMCTAVILAVDMVPRYEGPKTIAPFPAPNTCARPRTTANLNAKYQTFSPYQPFDENDTPTRGVADLSDDRGNVLFICPLCDPVHPNLLKDRRSLLTHLRGQHHGHLSNLIEEPVNELFGIVHCHLCELYYSRSTIKSHHCRPGVVRKLQQRNPHPTPPAPRAKNPSTGSPMLRPNEISPELVDRLTEISYDAIFASQAHTIQEIHHSSVNMWASVVALLLEGILLYAYGGVHGVENDCMAEAFLKLFLLAPRLIYHQDAAWRSARAYFSREQWNLSTSCMTPHKSRVSNRERNHRTSKPRAWPCEYPSLSRAVTYPEQSISS